MDKAWLPDKRTIVHDYKAMYLINCSDFPLIAARTQITYFL
jgi:hypothetical protein